MRPQEHCENLTDAHVKVSEDVLRDLSGSRAAVAVEGLWKTLDILAEKGYDKLVFVRGQSQLETLEIWAIPPEDG